MLLEFDGTFIFALISFVIFVILMNLILYRPITKIISERQKFFDKNLDTAETSKTKASEVLKHKEAEIQTSKLEAAGLVSAAQNKAKETRQMAVNKKKEEILDKISTNKAGLDAAKNEALEELQGDVSSYVSLVVSKVLYDKEEG